MRNVGDKVIVKGLGETGTILRVDIPQPNYLIKFDNSDYETCTYYEDEIEDITMNNVEIEQEN